MLKKFVLQPGFIRDSTDYAAMGGWWDGQWVRFHLQSAQSMGGYSHLIMNDGAHPQGGATYSGICRSLFSWSALDNTPLLAVGTHTNYYIFENSTLYDVTPAGLPVGQETSVPSGGYGSAYYGESPYGASSIGTVTPDQLSMRMWSERNWGQDLLICDADTTGPNGGVYYWAYPGTGNAPGPMTALSNMAGATGTPWIAHCVFVTDDRHAVALGASVQGAAPPQDPMNVMWSDIGNIADWTATDINEAGQYRLALGSRIVSGRPARQENLIWTDRALYSMKYVGAPYIFGFFLIADGISITGLNAPVDNGSAVFWMGLGEFFVYSGAAQILPCSIRDYVFNRLNQPYAAKCFGGLNRRFAEIWFFYPSTTGNNTEIDSYAVYNWVDNLWYFGTIARTAWNDPSVWQYPLGAGDMPPTGRIYQHEYGADADGQNLTSYIESADLDISDGDRFTFCRRVMPDIHFMQNILNPNPSPSVTVTVNFKPGPEMSPTKSVTVTYPQAGGMLYVRGRGRAATYKIMSVEKGVTWRAGNLRADVQPDGRR